MDGSRPIAEIAPVEREGVRVEVVAPREASGEEPESVDATGAVKLAANRQFTMLVTLAAYCGVVLAGVTHHEPWADEAQAWVLTRDLSYRYLLFHQLAYEGHPPLWPTILWLANHWFHLPYQSMGWIGGACAIAGCWFFCRYSPFPLWMRVLFPFTYFMGFQYAIVARDYVLLPLFSFAAAHFFAEAEDRPWRFVAATSGLMLLCAPGAMMAMGFMAARICYSLRSWDRLPPHARKRVVAALIVFGLVALFVARVNWPAHDGTFARLDRPVNNDANFGWGILPRDISIAFFGSPIPSAAFLLIAGVWCAYRRRFLAFFLPLGLVLGFFVKVYGYLWHCGALTMVAVAALWIAWNSPPVPMAKLQRAMNVLLLAAVAALFAVQIYWTARTLAMDYSRPYSGSADAANFLRSAGADRSSTCGFGFHAVALQPYFPKGLFMNWPESFWRHEQGNHNDANCKSRVEWVVAPICCTFDMAKQSFWGNDRGLRAEGYFPVHVSRGALFFEGREAEPTDYVIYRDANQASVTALP